MNRVHTMAFRLLISFVLCFGARVLRAAIVGFSRRSRTPAPTPPAQAAGESVCS